MTCDIPSSNTSDATSELNKDKNRYESYVPCKTSTEVHANSCLPNDILTSHVLSNGKRASPAYIKLVNLVDRLS